MTKMTKKVALECALCAVKNWDLKEYRSADDGTTFTADEVVAKLNEMWDALNKKSSSSSRKPTKTQIENEAHKTKIAEIIRSQGVPMTVTEVWKFPEFHDMSTQKVSALMNQMVDDFILIKSKRGRSSVFGFEAVEAE